MRKGFVLDDDRLKNLGGGGYFKELLERIRDIRDIRASEKVMQRAQIMIRKRKYPLYFSKCSCQELWSDLLDQYAKYHKTLHFDQIN